MKIVFPEYNRGFREDRRDIRTDRSGKHTVAERAYKARRGRHPGYPARGESERRRIQKSEEIVHLACGSLGLAQGAETRKLAVASFARKIMERSAEIEAVEKQMAKKCLKIPCAENILEIKGLGDRIVSGILAEIGDVNRFDAAKEI